MADLIHTEACRAAHRAWGAAAKDYNHKWPNHCATCGGWGVTGYASLGTLEDPPEEPDECSACLGFELCPRCGKPMRCATGEHCSECGWAYGEAGSEGMPSIPECDCWEEQLKKFEDRLKELDDVAYDELLGRWQLEEDSDEQN